MKPAIILACAVAVLTMAGCSSKQGKADSKAGPKVEQVKPPKRSDWTKEVAATAAGGFAMGNPNAKVKLIEFGSMTCSHCKEFDDEGVPHLLDYVKSGQVSWEFRNYVRDAFDVTAALIARCDGARSFFPLTRALYDDQDKWMTQVQKTPEAQLESMQDLPPDQQFPALANAAGLQQWAAAHGLPEARSRECLSNAKSVDQLARMTSDTTSQYPDFEGTPTFAINGKILDAASWDSLEPQLKDALAERE